MELLEHDSRARVRFAAGDADGAEQDERAARRTLRAQIAKLERELAEAFVTAYPMGGLDEAPARSCAAPRLLDLGELERVRDDLAARVRAARATISERAECQAANRVQLERMLLEPGRYRFVRISNRDIGEPGCGVWQVRPAARADRDADGLVAGQALLGLSVSHRPRRCRGPTLTAAGPSADAMRELLRTGMGATLVLLIMFIGSLVLWIGTPLLWLWVGSQIQGATSSLGTALGVSFIGVVATIMLLAVVLAKLSNVYQANRRARGLDDPGHYVLEAVLVVSAGITLAAFVVWFFFFAGASPVPVGIQL